MRDAFILDHWRQSLSSRRCVLPLLLSWIYASVWAEARLGKKAEVLTQGIFDDFVKKHTKVLVDFYDKRDDNFAAELDTAVKQLRDVGCRIQVGKVDAVAESTLAERFVPSRRYPQLLWFLNGEATKYHRTLRTAKHISDFVLALDRAPIVHIKSDEEAKNFNRAVVAHTTKSSSLYKALEVVASKHLDTVAFAVRDGADENVTFVADDEATVVFSGEHTVKAIDDWLRGVLVKSEAIPTDPPNEGEPVVVVGKTFEKMVLREDKDVFLLVYAPWCGHSRKVFPVWQVLAKAMTHVSHLVIAKMDGDRNSSPLPELFSWPAYPTIFYVKAGNRTPNVFHGNRTIANFVQFANEHGSAPFSIEDKFFTEDIDSLSEL